jgi:hypothetical protein
MGSAARLTGPFEELFLAFPVPRERIRDATHFRSTWLTGSITEIRNRGHGDAYEKLLPAEYRDEILSLVPGIWLPMQTARVHYTACNGLELPTTELVDIGASATRRANATALSFAVRVARGAGVTPWTILSQLQRIWDRTCMGGGGVTVYRLGPKEARAEIVGYPLAGLRYNRITFRGILGAILELFCQKLYVQEIARMCDNRCLGFRLSWA